MNDRIFLENVIQLLVQSDIQIWVFGGWAEELLGIIEPRHHKDIDLLYLSEDFDSVDRFITQNKIDEIIDKRMIHKRAFLFEGVMVELFLVQQDEQGYFTDFWGIHKHYWQNSTSFIDVDGVKVASKEVLLSYRGNFESIHSSV